MVIWIPAMTDGYYMYISFNLSKSSKCTKEKWHVKEMKTFLSSIELWQAIQVIQNKINFVRPPNDILQTKQNFAFTCRKSRFEKISMARYLLSRTLGSGSCSWRTIFKPVGVWSTVRNNRYWKVYSRVAGGSRKYPQYTSYIYTVPDRQPPLGWFFDREIFFSENRCVLFDFVSINYNLYNTNFSNWKGLCYK